MKKLLSFLAILMIAGSSLCANIKFYPRVIYVNAEAKYKNVYIENSSEEDTVYKLYMGYTAQDINGRFFPVKDINMTESDKEKNYCANLKVFPKRLTIKSGHKQLFKVIVKRPKEAVDKGEYYCRIYAKGQPVPVEIANTDENIVTKISTVFTVGAPIHIRVGKDSALNIKMSGTSASIKEGVFSFNTLLTNDTNMGLRGEINIQILSDDMQKPLKLKKQFTLQGESLNFEYKESLSELQEGVQYRIKVFMNDSHDVSSEYKLFTDDKLIDERQIKQIN